MCHYHNSFVNDSALPSLGHTAGDFSTTDSVFFLFFFSYFSRFTDFSVVEAHYHPQIYSK